MWQECIPVGCVPPAAVAVPGGLHQATPQSRHPMGADTPPEADTPREQTPPLWTEFLTHAYENITLPQTSFAGGKY